MCASRPMSLGIVIVNFWSAKEVAHLVDSIITAGPFTGTEVAMAIVDNSDEPEELSPTAELARRYSMKCHVLHGHGNVGYAAGNNLGAAWRWTTARKSSGSSTPTLGWPADRSAQLWRRSVPGGERVIAATFDADTSGPAIGALNLWTGQSGNATALQRPGGRRMSYVSGHSLALTRQAWIELGGLSEDYFLFYEEADLAFRGSRKGIPMMVIPGLMIKHIGGTTTGVSKDLRAKSRTAYFHASRSCLIFFRKHYRGRVPFIATMRVAYAAKVLFAGGAGAAGAILRGTAAGLAGLMLRRAFRSATLMYLSALAMSGLAILLSVALPPSQRGLLIATITSAAVGVAIGGLSLETFLLAQGRPWLDETAGKRSLVLYGATVPTSALLGWVFAEYSGEASSLLAAAGAALIAASNIPAAAGLAKANFLGVYRNRALFATVAPALYGLLAVAGIDNAEIWLGSWLACQALMALSMWGRYGEILKVLARRRSTQPERLTKWA